MNKTTEVELESKVTLSFLPRQPIDPSIFDQKLLIAVIAVIVVVAVARVLDNRTGVLDNLSLIENACSNRIEQSSICPIC